MAAQGIPGLLEKIRTVDRKGHWAETANLRQFGKTTAESVKTLAGKLESKNPNVRAQAVMALTGFGLAAGPAVPALTKALADDDDLVRLVAAMLLLRIDPKNQEAVKVASTALGVVQTMQLAAQEQKRHQLDADLEDPVLQAKFDRFVYIYVVMSASRSTMLLAPDIDSLPPAAVPALVRGLNMTAAFQLGFC